MTGTTHRLGGLAAGIAATQIWASGQPEIEAVLIGGAILGSLAPDLDHNRSYISYKWRLVSIIITFMQTIARAVASLFPAKQEKYIRGIVGHRGIFHSLLICVVAGALLAAVGVFGGGIIDRLHLQDVYYYFSTGVILGILSHLVLDMFAGGVPLLCPFSMRRVTLAHIKTGGIAEWLIRGSAISVFVMSFGERILNWI